ncbi:hypothetical protein J6590_038575 [Homalodisca vitripennis]|nr:hypothetical protein J6590_038575 [Homalodisca vitripennis]
MKKEDVAIQVEKRSRDMTSFLCAIQVVRIISDFNQLSQITPVTIRWTVRTLSHSWKTYISSLSLSVYKVDQGSINRNFTIVPWAIAHLLIKKTTEAAGVKVREGACGLAHCLLTLQDPASVGHIYIRPSDTGDNTDNTPRATGSRIASGS